MRREATETEVERPRVGGDDLRHVAASARHRPAPLPSAARLAADRHSRRVRRLKILLPSAAVATALVIVGVAWVQSRLMGSLDVKTVLFSKDGLTMVEPHLSGHAEGRAYDVSAQRAFQNIQNPKIIHLEHIDGRIEMADGSWAKIEASAGVYDGTREKLTLDGSVGVTTSTGWRAASTHAEADLVSGHIVTDKPISITGRTARIDADAIDVRDGGHHVLFTGHVRMEIRPADGAPSPAPAGGTSPASAPAPVSTPPAR